MVPRAALEKGGDFVTVAANRHGAPATAVGAGIVVEKQPARGIGAAADGRAGTFDQEFGGGTGKCGEQPVETAFSGDELQGPSAFVGDEFVVTFGYTENLIHRFYP